MAHNILVTGGASYIGSTPSSNSPTAAKVSVDVKKALFFFSLCVMLLQSPWEKNMKVEIIIITFANLEEALLKI